MIDILDTGRAGADVELTENSADIHDRFPLEKRAYGTRGAIFGQCSLLDWSEFLPGRKFCSVKDLQTATSLVLARFWLVVTIPPDILRNPARKGAHHAETIRLLIVCDTRHLPSFGTRSGPSRPYLPKVTQASAFARAFRCCLWPTTRDRSPEALDEDALTEKEQEAFLVDFEATMAVKQSRLELVRAIHQLEMVEKKCKGTPAGDEAAQLLKLLPQCKDLQPGRTATATASRKGTPPGHGRVAASEATKTK